jgi:hypothetical protein
MRTRPLRASRLRSRLTALVAIPFLTALVAVAGGAAAEAQDASRQDLAQELATLMLDESVRRGLDEQIGTAMVRAIGITLQERLNRNLQDAEWRSLGSIIKRFVDEALPSSRATDIAARVYARHFDASELKALVEFQRSEVGRKAARLTPVIGRETAEAVYADIWESPAMPRLLEELQREFPVLKSPESP